MYKMNHVEKERLIRHIFNEELMPIMNAKGHDYSGTEDALSNLKDFGWQGIIVRIGDKYHRIKNFIRSGDLKVKDENIQDTLKDLAVYSLLAILMYQEENK